MLNYIVWNLIIDKMMVVAKKMEVSSYILNFLAHSIEVVIVLIVLKLLIPDLLECNILDKCFLHSPYSAFRVIY